MSCNTDRWWLWPQNDTPPSVMVVMAAIGGTWEMGLGMVGQVFTTGFKMPYCRQPGDTKRRGFQKIHSADRILGGNHRNRVHFGEMCVFSCLNDDRHSPSPPLWKLTLAAGPSIPMKADLIGGNRYSRNRFSQGHSTREQKPGFQKKAFCITLFLTNCPKMGYFWSKNQCSQIMAWSKSKSVIFTAIIFVQPKVTSKTGVKNGLCNQP